jgi:hypothetical protein
VIAIDDSGSEFGPHGTDPNALRYRAARFASDFLGSIATAGLNHRVGIVRFGSRAPRSLAVPLSPVPAGLPTIDSALAGPRQLGETNFAAAFARARHLFGPAITGRKRLLLIFTDGTPHVGPATLDALFRGIGAEKARLPGVQIALLGVDDTGKFDQLAPRWRALGLSTVQRLSSVSEGSLSAAFVRLLAADLGLQQGNEAHLDQVHQRATVTVEPYQEALVITHFGPDADTTLEVRGPDGKVVGTTHPGRAGLLTLKGPAPGKWTIRLVRGSRATVAIDQVRLQARLIEPALSTIPVGRTLRIEATFRTSDNNVLPELPQYPRYFGATVTAPDGSQTPVQLESLGHGLYRASKAVAIPQPGAYSVLLTLKGAEQQALQTDRRLVQAAIQPYLTIDRDRVNSREELTVPLSLELNGRPIDAKAALSDDPNAVGVARLFDDHGRQIETTRLRWKTGSDFVAHFHTRPDDGQLMTITATLTGTTRRGSSVHDEARAELTASPTSGAKLADVVWTIVLVVLAILAVALVALGTWWWTRPPVRGRFRIDGKLRNMSRRRHDRIGRGAPVRPVTWIWGAKGNRVRYRRGRLPLPWGWEEKSSTSTDPIRAAYGE